MAEIEVYDSITDLEISNNNHKLKVKILKTWRRPVFNNPKHTYSLEFVCADEQGNRAQGSCLATFFYRFERFLEEQNVLTIKKPLLGSNGGSWTVINSPLKICFNRESQLALSPEWSGSRHSFSFTDFRTIIDCQASRTSSIGHYCVVLQFARFKIFEAGTSRHSVSNSFNNSNLFINDSDIEEITTFLARFSETEDGQSSSTYKSGSLSVLISKEEDFLDVTDFMYSAQVADITEPKTVVVLGTIKMVNNQWFYMACNHCLRKVESQLEPLKVTEGEPGSSREVVTYYCKNPACNEAKKVIRAYPRYMVLLKVQDSTGTVDLTLFDSEAKKIINKTALEVHDNYTPDPKLKEDALAINVPDEIASFIDKRYAFKITVTDNHISKRFKSYTIKALTDDEVILTALDEKYFKHELGTDDSDFLSTQNTSGKLKRNLDDSFESQELLTMSSAKKQSSSSNSESSSKGEFDGIVDGKLLIPKKEKMENRDNCKQKRKDRKEILDAKRRKPMYRSNDQLHKSTAIYNTLHSGPRLIPQLQEIPPLLPQLKDMCSASTVTFRSPLIDVSNVSYGSFNSTSQASIKNRNGIPSLSKVVSPNIASGKENHGKPVRRPTILIADNINSAESSSRSSQFRNTSSSNNLSTLSRMSSISSLSSGRHTLRPKTFNNTPVPMMDITSDGFGGFTQPTRDTTVGISKGMFTVVL
ncbi:hypothetical protein SSX86_022898 [Deinandra increscens subsp. villosa]|uniref:Replication factor A C-terminal domain-containing protein n=1 Tax=Deinandra increscens subsp. villosa TaxID=3103831 RepID=A0AAP0CRG4_9ASTR